MDHQIEDGGLLDSPGWTVEALGFSGNSLQLRGINGRVISPAEHLVEQSDAPGLQLLAPRLLLATPLLVACSSPGFSPLLALGSLATKEIPASGSSSWASAGGPVPSSFDSCSTASDRCCSSRSSSAAMRAAQAKTAAPPGPKCSAAVAMRPSALSPSMGDVQLRFATFSKWIRAVLFGQRRNGGCRATRRRRQQPSKYNGNDHQRCRYHVRTPSEFA